MDDKIKSLIESLSKSSESNSLKNNSDWIKLLETISDSNVKTDGKQYRIRYFIDNFLKINLEFPILDISIVAELFSDYEYKKNEIRYPTPVASLLIRSTYEEIFHIVNDSLFKYEYFRNLMVAILFNDKNILNTIKFDETKFSQVINKLRVEECFYAIYSYHTLKVDIPEKYIAQILESDDSSEALEILYIIDKYYPNKITPEQFGKLLQKVNNFQSQSLLNSVPTFIKLLKHNSNLIVINDETSLSYSVLFLLAKSLGNPECDEVFHILLTQISDKPDISNINYILLYKFIEVNTNYKWDTKRLNLLKTAFEKSEKYFHHYALIYGTIVKDIKEKNFLLEKFYLHSDETFGYFFLAYASSNEFPELFLQSETTILKSESRFIYRIIQAIWKKEKSGILDMIIRKIEYEFSDDDNLMQYIYSTLFKLLRRNPPPYARLKYLLNERVTFIPYSLKYLKKFSKYFSSMINSYSLNTFIQNSKDKNIEISEKFTDERLSRICLLLSLANNVESEKILESHCNSIENLNNFVLFLSRYDGKTEIFEMFLKIITINTNSIFELSEKESILLSYIFFFNKNSLSKLNSTLEYIKFHPSTVSIITTYLYRFKPRILLSMAQPNSQDPLLSELNTLYDSPSQLNQIKYSNFFRFIKDYYYDDEIDTFMRLAVLKDKNYGITNIINFGNIDLFNRRDNFDFFWKSNAVSQKVKCKYTQYRILTKSLDSENFDSYIPFFKNHYNEDVHSYLLNYFNLSIEDSSALNEDIFKGLFYYEGKNSKYSYISLSGNREILEEMNIWLLNTQPESNQINIRRELKKILDYYKTGTPEQYYQNIFNPQEAMKYNGRKILIQNFNIENQIIGNQLDRYTLESIFAGITIDYIDEDTNSIIGIVTNDKSEELFNALFNDEDNLLKLTQCSWS